MDAHLCWARATARGVTSALKWRVFSCSCGPRASSGRSLLRPNRILIMSEPEARGPEDYDAPLEWRAQGRLGTELMVVRCAEGSAPRRSREGVRKTECQRPISTRLRGTAAMRQRSPFLAEGEMQIGALLFSVVSLIALDQAAKAIVVARSADGYLLNRK